MQKENYKLLLIVINTTRVCFKCILAKQTPKKKTITIETIKTFFKINSIKKYLTKYLWLLP